MRLRDSVKRKEDHEDGGGGVLVGVFVAWRERAWGGVSEMKWG